MMAVLVYDDDDDDGGDGGVGGGNLDGSVILVIKIITINVKILNINSNIHLMFSALLF